MVVAYVNVGTEERAGALYRLRAQAGDGTEPIRNDIVAESLPWGAFAPAEVYDVVSMQRGREDLAHFANALRPRDPARAARADRHRGRHDRGRRGHLPRPRREAPRGRTAHPRAGGLRQRGAVVVGVYLGHARESVQKGVFHVIGVALPSVSVLIVVGMIIGVWIASGTVPTLIYYGLTLLSPEIFLAAAMVLCAVVSVPLGTSWGTVGTVGLALMGIGAGFGIPVYRTAGAVVSGAFFGDKISPLSDTTNLAPAVTGTSLFDHLRNMMPTTVPAMLIALGIYLWVGYNTIGEGDTSFESIDAITVALQENFLISPWLLLPALLVIVLALFRKPPLPSLFAGVVVGGIMAMALQGASLHDVFSFANSGYTIDTGIMTIEPPSLMSGDRLWTRYGGATTFTGSCAWARSGSMLPSGAGQVTPAFAIRMSSEPSRGRGGTRRGGARVLAVRLRGCVARAAHRSDGHLAREQHAAERTDGLSARLLRDGECHRRTRGVRERLCAVFEGTQAALAARFDEERERGVLPSGFPSAGRARCIAPIVYALRSRGTPSGDATRAWRPRPRPLPD